MIQASILSIGDELVSGITRDANACWLAEQLAGLGVRVGEIRIVPDDREAIGRAVHALASAVELLFLTGGLGPTADDLTRDALNDVVDPGEGLVEDAAAVAQIEEWFNRRGAPMPAINRVQARRPRSAAMIENYAGTAPGLRCRWGQCTIFVMPGVPREMREMFSRSIRPEVDAAGGGRVLLKRSIHVHGLGESSVAELLGDLLSRTNTPTVGTTASDGTVSARIYAWGSVHEARGQLDGVSERIESVLFPYCFGRDEESLAGAVGGLLTKRGERLATAESCTGGGVGSELTAIAGSSDWYAGGWVTYSNEMKAVELGVPRELIGRVGAVSREVARSMAAGALERSSAHHAVAITGIAGPGGGSAQKPVGTVYIGLASRKDAAEADVEVRHFIFAGDRAGVRRRAIDAALQMVRWRLLGVGATARLSLEVANTSVDGGKVGA